jgi:extracellular elastinolytic metalloproteinase
MPRFRALTALLALTIGAVTASTASAVTAPRTAARPYFDLRSSTAATSTSAAGASSARSALRRDLGRGAAIDVDRSTGTTHRIARAGRALTGPASGDRRAIAESYIRRHADVIGLSAQDLGTLELARRTESPGGVLYLSWRQSVRGIPLFDGGLRASVAADGRIVSIGGAPVRGLASAATTPALDSAEALKRAREDARAKDGSDASDYAGLVLYATGRDVRLAWATTVHASSQATYHTLVDAGSGAILHRQNLVKFAAPALMFDRYPGASPGGTQTSVDLEARGWLNPGSLNLTGPFARAYSDLNDSNTVNAGEEVTRASASGSFAFSFVPFTQAPGGCDPTHQCSWNFDVGNSWVTNRSQTTVQAFAYVSSFRDHLAAAPIGFDAASGGFEGTDRVTVEADDGAVGPSGRPDANHRDNANMETFPDGTPPRMQMYLFFNNGDFRDINGGDDAAIVYHEYTHGLSNRLITLSNGVGALDDAQPGAMGEAWSDFYAKDLLANQGLQPDTAAPGEVDMGEYTDSVPHRIRSQPMDCPVAVGTPACPGAGTAGPSGYTYGDFGNIAGGPEVHADGEIWGETLWDLRTEVGSAVAEALVTGGMRGSPPEPTFLDARDAIMDADVALFGGHHMAALWRVFARRGMGTDAATTGSGDTNPHEGFAKPADQAPTGSMSATPANVAPGANVHFDAGAIQDVDGVVREYRWDFDGNGSVDRTTTTPTTDFAYSAAGNFAAAVTAVDDGGNTVRPTTNVAVVAPLSSTLGESSVSLGRIVVANKVTVDRRGRFGVRVTFAQGARSGKAKLLVFRKGKRIGSATATVKKGLSVRFKVKLTKAGLRALKKATKFNVSIRLQLPGSTTIAATKNVQLKAPKR